MKTDEIKTKEEAALLAVLGGNDSVVIEWNRVKKHEFILSTFIPEQIYSPISLEIARFLVEEKNIPTELGYDSSDSWYNPETEEYEYEPAENYTQQLLKQNKS